MGASGGHLQWVPFVRGAWSRPRQPPASTEQRLRQLDSLSGLGAIAVLGFALATGVIAQSPADPLEATATGDPAGTHGSSRSTAEYMISGYGGAPYTYPSDVTVKAPGVHDFTVKDVAWDGEPFKNPIYYGVRVSRWGSGGRTGSMVDFTHSKAIARRGEEAVFTGTLDGQPAPERAKIGDFFRRLEASHGHNMLTLNGLLRLPRLSARIIPYVGFGAGVSLPHSEVQLVKDNARTYEYQYAGPVAQALIGIEFRGPRASTFIEYKFTLASYDMPLTRQDGSILFFDLWGQFMRWWRVEEPVGGRLGTQFTSHQAIAGIGVRLGAPAAAP